MPDEARLLELASAVAEGSDVDWDEVERSSHDERERSLIREMRLVARISDIARNPSMKHATPAEDAGLASSPATWGHLRILNQIGRGSFGTVYRAWDGRLEREVALKLMPGSAVAGGFDLTRALKEGRILARIRHPNVATVHGADWHDGRFGIWMELITGHTLEELLVLHGTMSAREAAAVGVDLCHALAAVHRARLLHRDIKASNAMREEGGRIVLMDFGAGRPIPAGHEPTYALAGTPQYLAPELFAGANPSVSSDIYGLGVLLYHIVTGAYPVSAEALEDIAVAHRLGQRLSLRDMRPNLPSSFVEVIERALSVKPEHRYRTAGEFGAALAGIAGIRYIPDPVRIPRWTMAAAAGIVVALVAVGAQLVRDDAAVPGQLVSDIPLPAGPATPAAYRIGAAFYAVRNGRNVQLTEGSRVAPGDRLFLQVEASQPVFVYVVNQDERGDSYLLFPLSGYAPGNPIPVGRTNRLPGSRDGQEHDWHVTSAGGREHFFIYVTPQRLIEFEQLLAALPQAELGRAVESVSLSNEAVGVLRGVGGLAQAGPSSTTVPAPALAELAPLPNTTETANGVWARRLTLDNPLK